MTLPRPTFNEVREFRLTDWVVTLSMPEGAEILNVGWRGTRPVMWALVDNTRPLISRRFVGVRSGADIPAEGSYRGTVVSAQLTEGGNQIVAHVFEVPI